MESNVNAELKDLHNKMVCNISTEIFGDQLEKVKFLFKDNPLTPFDMFQIKNIETLFERLMNYETIDYGNYQKFVTAISCIHPRVCSIVQRHAAKINKLQGNLDDQGSSTAKQPKTEDQSQQQSTARQEDMAANISVVPNRQEDMAKNISVVYNRLEDMARDMHNLKGDLAAKNVTTANTSHAKKIHPDLEPMIAGQEAMATNISNKQEVMARDIHDLKGDLAAMNVRIANTSLGQKIHPDLEPMIEDTYRLLAQKYKVTDDCIVPVKDASNQEELIIIYDPSCNTERRLKEFGHDVIIRNQKYVSTEGAIVSSICKTEQYSIRPEDRNNLKQTLNHHMKRLFASHSNLNIITTSPVKSKNKGDDIIEGPCIVLVCSSKGYIPNGESKFPKELIFEKTTYMVDVREGYFQFSPYSYSTNSSSHFHQNIKMGCSFGIEGTTNAGTVGPFVDSQGHQLFLTCAHIVNGVDPKGYDLKNIQNMFAEQPDAMTFCESSQRCGEVRRAVFLPDNNPSSVDAAVVQITEQSRIPSRGEFAIDSELNLKAAGFDDLPRFESGEIHDDPDTLDIDLRIVKFGAKTHATRGVISSHGTAARPLTTNLGLLGQPNMCVMKNQIEVFSLEGHSHFFSLGDSGSGVFVVNKLSTGERKLTCIGLAIGCTSYGSAVVTPIAAVLDALGLPRRLKQFP